MPPHARGILARKAAKTERLSSLGLVAPPPLTIECPAYSGSLATLFQGVHDHRIDLLHIPLLPICQAYFEYLLTTENSTLDEAAAAMMALAYLLERKAWGLLPSMDPEPDLDPDLPLSLPTAHEYAIAIEALRLWREEREQFFFRPVDQGPDPYEVPCEMGDVTPGDLARALERLLRKASPASVSPITKARRSLSEQMVIVLRALSTTWRTLDELVPQPFTREDAVYWFLSLLELIRLGQARARVTGEDVSFSKCF